MIEIREMIDPVDSLYKKIIMKADLSDLSYLYQYGFYIGENERGIAAFLNELSEEERDEVDENLTELIVAKNRHGGVGTIQLTFDKEFTRFRSIDNVRDYSQS